MALTNPTTIDITKALQHEIEKRVREAVNAAVVKAKAEVNDALWKEVGSIALSILNDYELYRDRQNIVITVKDRTK